MSLDSLGKRVGLAWILSLGFVLAGCEGDSDSEGKGPEAKILEFVADAEAVRAGESTTLRWSTRGAISVILLENGFKRHADSLPAEGSLEVTPEGGTSYRLEARGKDGRPVAAEVIVAVERFGEPEIDHFTASPSVVARGTPVTLSWKVLGAEHLEIGTSLGESVATISPVEREGSIEVRPTQSTTYVLRARNDDGASSAEVEVVVGRLPSVHLEVSAERVGHGDDLTLSWTVADAETLTVFDPQGQVLHEGPAADGELVVSATGSGAYRATAVGPGGEATAIAQIAVTPRIEEFTATAQGGVRPGNEALVSWSVKGVDRVVISNGMSEVVESSKAADSVSAPIGNGGAFILRAYSGSEVAVEHALIRVVEEPLIRRLTTGPLVSAGRGVAGWSTIGWEVDGASHLKLEVEPGGLVDITDKNPRRDEVEVLFTNAGTITLTAYNNAGWSQMVIDSPVDPVPFIDRLFAAPSRAGAGEGVEIHWETTFAQEVILEQDGRQLEVDPSAVDGSFATDILSARSSFTLRAFNGLGHEVVSEPLWVEVGAPNQIRFDTADGLRYYRVRDPVELVWENDGGTQLTVSWGNEEVCTVTSAIEIREGGCTFKMPDEQQVITLVLEVRNASGVDTRTLEIEAVSGPIIVSFETDVDEITEGDNLLFSWVTLPDNEGNIPTLFLVDNRNNEYILTDIEGQDALEGSKRFRIHGWGGEPRTFTLKAKTSIDPVYELTKTVMVHGIPTFGEISANPIFAENEGDPVQLSWTTQHGVSLEIYPLAEGGVPADSPSLVILDEPERVANGSTQWIPSIAEPHVRLVAINPLGVRTEADFRIGVNPATIVSFKANGIEAPAVVDILEGEEVTFEWEVVRSTDVELREEYISIANDPGTSELAGLTSWSSRASIPFPSGFRFPHGEEQRAVLVAVSGWLSFDLDTGSALPGTLPSSTANTKKIDFFPFWTDQRPSAEVLWNYYEEPSPHLVIEWKGASFWNDTSSNLNYQAILHASGAIEYRYGPMNGFATNTQTMGIATASRSGDDAHVIYLKTSSGGTPNIPGGLEGRSFYFEGWDGFREDLSTPRPTAPTGTWTIRPLRTRNYTLRAWNGHSNHEEALEVRVHGRGELEVWADPAEPAPGQPTTLRWSGKHLTELVIEDDQGNVIHTATPGQLSSGNLLIGPLTMGDHSYKFRAVGLLPRDEVERDLDILVYDAFSLDSFSADSEFIELTSPRTPVTLSWATTNATSVRITASDGSTYEIPPAEFAAGSLVLEPEVTTTYTMRVESHGRIREAAVLVEVQTTWVDLFEGGKSWIFPGESTQLTWATRGNGTVTLTGVSSPGASGNTTVSPSKRTVYTVCIDDGNWRDCRSFEVNVLEPGDLVFSELMLDPGSGAPQWFEVANLSGGSIDLEGFEIHMGSQTHLIQSGGPLVLEKGGVMVFAQAQGPGLDPDYVYGSAMEMTTPSGNVALYWDTTKMAETSWSGWTVPTAGTLEMRTDHLTNGTVSWTSSSAYVATVPVYDGTNKGTPGTWGVVDSPDYIVHFLASDEFIDIRDTGKEIPAMIADSGRAGIPVDFSMPFFGSTVNNIWADANGWISFAAAQPSTDHFAPTSVPRGATETPLAPIVSVFWDDFGCSQSPDPAFFHYEQRELGGQTVTILQWTNARRCSNTGGVTFQVQLWENGDIVVAFDEMWWGSTSAEATYRGNAAWIAIEPPGDPTAHLTVLYKKPLAFPGRAYLFQHK